MGEVNVDDLKEGMVLAGDLKDSRGRYLLGRGSVIEDKHIRVMKIWGITSADIEGVSREAAAQKSLEQIDPGILQKAKAYVEALLSHSSESHDALEELKRLCILRTAKNLSEGKTIEETEPVSPGQDLAKSFEFEPPEKIIPLQALAEKSVKLSSFPDIYYQIVEVLNDTGSSAVRLAEVVSTDTSLSATLLKLVNSAYYGVPSQIDSIPRAIALIGGRELSTLAMGISVIRYFKDIPPHLVDMKSYWLHSITCGVIARILANRIIDISEELYFLGGLMHDIGRLVLFREFPKTMAHAIQLSKDAGLPLFEVEQEVFGYDHTRIAGLILEKWNFPRSLVQMIRYHHLPFGFRSPLESSIILAADIVATTLRFGYSGNHVVSAFEKKVWDTIGLSPSVLGPSIEQADRQVHEILSAFHLNEADE